MSNENVPEVKGMSLPCFMSDSLFDHGDALITVAITFYARLAIIHKRKSSVGARTYR